MLQVRFDVNRMNSLRRLRKYSRRHDSLQCPSVLFIVKPLRCQDDIHAEIMSIWDLERGRQFICLLHEPIQITVYDSSFSLRQVRLTFFQKTFQGGDVIT